ncbi:FAD:protein FMN transferase [Aeromonas simiae]|uniref:FAD:protein FMN transferase n=1 Tax=Aeromonas simiae TaxID=218936 RepID=UPI00266CBCC8|nr:FAD:protein FMN transferase [Aeromonas simiae]MDO2947134.1 FAD:protein FMN transferase [Aeromonas simiae]MDO2950746.1 FAD:protein FMN transferase [Aeromonas simiae]MDO2954272.1 FAD:protein FMN transferase [Aeromonas simiae]
MRLAVRTWLALFGLAFFLTGCGQEKVQTRPEIHITGSTMGTYYSIKVADPVIPDVKAFQTQIDLLLERVNDQMSTYRPESELSRFNQSRDNRPVVVSRDTARVVIESLHLGRESRGALDVTVGPLVNLWGFGPDKRPTKVPSDELIAQTRQKSGLGNLHVVTSADADTLQKDIPDLYVDLSAIAKGFGVDKVAEYIESLGARNYLVEIGGELRLNGHNGKGHPWRVAIEKPVAGSEQGSVQEVIVVGDNGVATSGDYRNYYEMDGQRFSHTIDPATGKPIQHRLVSVTVVHPSCMTADGLATALTVMGPEKGMAFAKEKGLAIFMVVKTDEGFREEYSEAFKPYLVRK